MAFSEAGLTQHNTAGLPVMAGLARHCYGKMGQARRRRPGRYGRRILQIWLWMTRRTRYRICLIHFDPIAAAPVQRPAARCASRFYTCMFMMS
jgi:hypothetical protein